MSKEVSAFPSSNNLKVLWQVALFVICIFGTVTGKTIFLHKMMSVVQ